MRGEITLESELGRGTKANFWIPFNKPHFTGGGSPLVDLGSIPVRLQSEMSVSGCPSDARSGGGTPPMSPLTDGAGLVVGHHRKGHSASSSVPTPLSSAEELVPDIDRQNIHVLVVEDKSV